MPRRFLKVEDEGRRTSIVPAISAVVLTPHRDLAYQFIHWVQCLYATKEFGDATLSSIAQAVVRGSSTPIATQARAIVKNPPHILIGTPQAILEALQLEQSILPMRELATVVVDEADSMLECPPRADKYLIARYLRMLKRHPSHARQILDAIYRVQRFAEWCKPKLRKELEDAGTGGHLLRSPSGIVKTHLPLRRPQLVFASATLKAAFRHGLLSDGKWLTPEESDLVKVITHAEKEDQAAHILGSATTVHSALVYSTSDGSIINIKNAAEAQPEQILPAKPVNIETEPAVGETFSSALDTRGIIEEAASGLKSGDSKPSPFPEPAMEAIATVFALEVPRVALLVLHPSASVGHAVEDMRRLGIDAHGLDVVQRERGGSYLLRKGTAPEDDPTLLVATLASIRGLDMPDLTHVFILGASEALDQDSYTHAAGRVGRFGKSGKVITVVGRRHVLSGKVVDEPNRMTVLYKKLHVTPVRVEHFGLNESAKEEKAESSSADNTD
ncbi:uncharacterized protein PHACADRAFT_247700 [Phanerochaete carnosa HHB-10118-sp]|uniref:ATP-dependent RNA helicase n=1 Tax=Phanerochaete carnosa (strain HHB-10118-sp) TaxID=650164 RepID=K5WP38_PHACS|nr:uncharacterized protein PHACADRAFT_247700 [Phanerochaete carnosa HHB-10118-sp]EKM61225.1 hypothetical protein PHACADRAFT_247700 [Phanerochaete carnosa HHB-10118-sp]